MALEKTAFRRYFVFVGIFLVLFIAASVTWVQDYIVFQKIEEKAVRQFKQYKIMEDDEYVPQMQVAGPTGEFVPLLEGGKYTVLNIWATWCAPCVKELPALQNLQKVLYYDENAWRVVAVSIDSRKDISKVIKFTKRLAVEEVASYHDFNGEVQKEIEFNKLPMTLILSKNGRILYKVYGDTRWNDPNIIKFLKFMRRTK